MLQVEHRAFPRGHDLACSLILLSLSFLFCDAEMISSCAVEGQNIEERNECHRVLQGPGEITCSGTTSGTWQIVHAESLLLKHQSGRKKKKKKAFMNNIPVFLSNSNARFLKD